MTRVRKCLLEASLREEGATMVEYGLMVALIAVVAVSAVGVLGGNVSETFSELTF